MNPKEACDLLGVRPPEMRALPREEQIRLLQEWKDGPLKKAWRVKAKEHHPDASGAGDQLFKKMSEANDLLKNMQLTPERSPDIVEDDPTPHLRRFAWGPVEITLSAEDEKLLRGLGEVLQSRLDKLVAKQEVQFRKSMVNGFGDLLDSLLEAPRPRAKKPRPRRTTTIG